MSHHQNRGIGDFKTKILKEKILFFFFASSQNRKTYFSKTSVSSELNRLYKQKCSEEVVGFSDTNLTAFRRSVGAQLKKKLFGYNSFIVTIAISSVHDNGSL